MSKCLHCDRSVDFISGRGWVHMPEGRAYVMQHEVMDEKRLRNYNSGMDKKRGKGCGWVGLQPADMLTWATDICPKCGAQGELADHHVASPSHETSRQELGTCTFPERCQRADWKDCDCSCGGSNHGVQVKMFK